MASLDTNLLVRLLVADDAAQLREVEALIRSVQRRGDTLFVPITVADRTAFFGDDLPLGLTLVD